MFLIAKNKIINYINVYPQSRVSLMLWLKSVITSRTSNIDFYSLNYFNECGVVAADQFVIQYESNSSAKTIFIKWIGTKFDYEEKQKIELAEIENYYLTVGVPLDNKLGSFTDKPIQAKRNIRGFKKPSFNSNLVDKIKILDLDLNIKEVKHLKTFEEYTWALDQVFSLSKLGPDSTEYLFLMNLIIKIDHYEKNQIVYPKIKNREILKTKINLFYEKYMNVRKIGFNI